MVSLSTDALDDHGFLDPRYTCDFDNSSPELRWEGTSENAVSFAVVAEDPDAPGGIFTHWLIYNIPAALRHLPAGIPPQDTLPNGIKQGLNSFGKLGYAGPCPPVGDREHRYVFRLYVLSRAPELTSRAQREELLAALSDCTLETGELHALYRRHAQRAG
jgi:Raf kinase inhibitor-like YbhB/YbcL family protein